MQKKCDKKAVLTLMELPLFEVVNKAYKVHKQHFNPTEIEFCVLSSIKTGACPEDCAYCPQSAHYDTGLTKEKLLDVDSIMTQAENAQDRGAKRFCMAAAWRSPPKKDFPKALEIIQKVKLLGLETCMTLGLLNETQAIQLKKAGLDYYNHNIDSSPEFYPSIITTRTYESRLETIKHVINAGIGVCCGGILGMGESRDDRIALLLELKKLPVPPKSIPINKLMPIKGTPLEAAEPLDYVEFVKTIAVTRLLFPTSIIRLSAGREGMSEESQAWCFMAGANSIFIGDRLITAPNQKLNQDMTMLKKLGIKNPSAAD